MKFSNYEHLKRWEGCRLTAYKDIGGIWTIGYGSTGSNVFPGLTITQAEADRLLDQDLVRFEKTVNENVRVPINQNQYDALVSLSYNIGTTAFSRSTVLRRLNEGDYEGAADAILWWNKVKGKVIKGLVNRRKAERELFLTPYVGKSSTQADKEARLEALVREFIEELKTLVRE